MGKPECMMCGEELVVDVKRLVCSKCGSPHFFQRLGDLPVER